MNTLNINACGKEEIERLVCTICLGIVESINNNVLSIKESTYYFISPFTAQMLGKGYVYADIRNIITHMDNEDARSAFLSEYGIFNEKEKIVDDVICSLNALYIACQRKHFPDWGNNLLARVKDGRLQTAVEKLLEVLE